MLQKKILILGGTGSIGSSLAFEVKKLGYEPVGVGNDNFSKDWLRDNTLQNISSKNKYYGEYSFHYWFWKNMLPKMADNAWIGFCGYRHHWSNNNQFKSDELKEKVNNINLIIVEIDEIFMFLTPLSLFNYF